MTIEMLTNRVENLEKQLALLLKQGNTEVEVKTKKEPKTKKSKGESSDEVKKPKKEAKSKTDSSDEEVKKKRGTNGYILFSKSVREEVIAKLTVGDEKPKNTEIMKQQAAMWAEVDADEKAQWNAKATELNAKAAE
jgi:hypothetical protein